MMHPTQRSEPPPDLLYCDVRALDIRTSTCLTRTYYNATAIAPTIPAKAKAAAINPDSLESLAPAVTTTVGDDVGEAVEFLLAVTVGVALAGAANSVGQIGKALILVRLGQIARPETIGASLTE
jgi:hypothetical protein